MQNSANVIGLLFVTVLKFAKHYASKFTVAEKSHVLQALSMQVFKIFINTNLTAIPLLFLH